MKIALVQQHASPDRDENIERGAEALRHAAREGAKLAAYPELSFTRFFPQRRKGEQAPPHAETIPGPTTELFTKLARELGMVVVINLYEKDGARMYDSSPVIDADGKLLGVTRMIHIIDSAGFHETDFYTPGDRGAPVYDTAIGRIGVAICYDRHFPEYMRALGLKGAQLVVIPQAGGVDEWPPGVFEAELQIAGFQNGYFTALANRVGQEDPLNFAGQSFVTDPFGRVIAQAPQGKDHILYADVDFSLIETCPARKHFWRDRRPEVYPL